MVVQNYGFKGKVIKTIIDDHIPQIGSEIVIDSFKYKITNILNFYKEDGWAKYKQKWIADITIEI